MNLDPLKISKVSYCTKLPNDTIEALLVDPLPDPCDILKNIIYPGEALAIYRNSSDGSRLQESAKLKADELFLEQLRQPLRERDLLLIFRDAPVGSNARKVAFEKLNTIILEEIDNATTISQVRVALQFAPKESPAEQAGFAKWDKLSKELGNWTKLGSVAHIFGASREGSLAQREALQKLYDLA